MEIMQHLQAVCYLFSVGFVSYQFRFSGDVVFATVRFSCLHFFGLKRESAESLPFGLDNRCWECCLLENDCIHAYPLKAKDCRVRQCVGDEQPGVCFCTPAEWHVYLLALQRTRLKHIDDAPVGKFGTNMATWGMHYDPAGVAVGGCGSAARGPLVKIEKTSSREAFSRLFFGGASSSSSSSSGGTTVCETLPSQGRKKQKKL
jgi:hypothetical protein